jgi:phosphohistidine phosphatase
VDLYLIRHADALAAGDHNIARDFDRPLSEEGVRQAEGLTAGLRKRNVALDVVFTSPLVRARQTAEGMLRHWPSPAPELRTCDDLAPDGKSRKLGKLLREVGVEAVALVGHQPDLSRHAGWLIGNKKAQVEFAKGGVAYIHLPGKAHKGAGNLIWLVTPEWLNENPNHSVT